jgi:hypothetical protein
MHIRNRWFNLAFLVVGSHHNFPLPLPPLFSLLAPSSDALSPPLILGTTFIFTALFIPQISNDALHHLCNGLPRRSFLRLRAGFCGTDSLRRPFRPLQEVCPAAPRWWPQVAYPL